MRFFILTYRNSGIVLGVYIYIYIHIRLHTYTVIGKALFHYRRVYPIVIQHDRSSSSEAQHLRHSGHTAVTW